MTIADLGSPFGLGCVNLGGLGRKGIRLIHGALDRGVRVFDTADVYGGGSSERLLGRALEKRRDQAYLATKCGYVFRERSAWECAARGVAQPVLHRLRRLARPTAGAAGGPGGYGRQDFTVSTIRAALEASLRRLNTDHVDLYQLHGPHGVCRDEVLALMLDLRSEGKIGGFGVGLEHLADAMDWLTVAQLASIQIPFGVLDPAAGDAVIPNALARRIPVLARGTFAGGLLVRRSEAEDRWLTAEQVAARAGVLALASATGVDYRQIAAWYVTAVPGVTTVLVGTSRPDHLEQSQRFVETPAPPEMLPVLAALGANGGQD